MKYCVLNVFVLALCLFHPTYGQRTAISSEEFYKAIEITKEPIRFPARSSNKTELFVSGELKETTLSQWEGTPNEADHLKVIVTKNGKESISEEIVFGDFIYSRTGDGEWKSEPWYFRHGRTEVLTYIIGTPKYWKQSSIIDKKAVTIYRETILVEISGTKAYRDDEYFFSNSKKLLKQVTTYRSVKSEAIIRRVTFSSEYDSTIKVVAPIK
ncbi:MAG: hypothetical protein IPL32_16480 [Chloracidobacterium sp.]|nr:hypothetical protein [Chloracidobacterium sp.]